MTIFPTKRPRRGHRPSFIAGVMAAALVVVVLAPASGAVVAKVEICHKPGTPAEMTIEVPPADVDTHLGHGDTVGPCAVGQASVEYTCDSSAHTFETLYVRAGVKGAMKGTIDKPFDTVSAALRHAEQEALPAVELQLGPGEYGPDVVAITRHTRIVGPGRDATPTVDLSLSISSSGPYGLGIQGVVFQANDSSPALTIENGAAETALCDLGFHGLAGHAVSQGGGSISAENLVIESTRRAVDPAEDCLTGTAVILYDAVSASMSGLQVTSSEGSGIYAGGDGTTVLLDWTGGSSSISGSLGCKGAVVVTLGAEFNSKHLDLDGNRRYGVNVSGAGTHADLRFLEVYNTLVSEECDPNGAIGVLAYPGATVEITGDSDHPFILDSSEFIGAEVHQGASLTLTHGQVSNNSVGLHVQDPDFDFDNIQDVDWIDNVVNVDGLKLPIPKPSFEVYCDNGIDDDGDGLIDCGTPSAPDPDPDCFCN